LKPGDRRSQQLVILDFHVLNCNERSQLTWRFAELVRVTRTSHRISKHERTTTWKEKLMHYLHFRVISYSSWLCSVCIPL